MRHWECANRPWGKACAIRMTSINTEALEERYYHHSYGPSTFPTRLREALGLTTIVTDIATLAVKPRRMFGVAQGTCVDRRVSSRYFASQRPLISAILAFKIVSPPPLISDTVTARETRLTLEQTPGILFSSRCCSQPSKVSGTWRKLTWLFYGFGQLSPSYNKFPSSSHSGAWSKGRAFVRKLGAGLATR
jgi:hypothetical protein